MGAINIVGAIQFCFLAKKIITDQFINRKEWLRKQEEKREKYNRLSVYEKMKADSIANFRSLRF